jgi:hypothetical protein
MTKHDSRVWIWKGKKDYDDNEGMESSRDFKTDSDLWNFCKKFRYYKEHTGLEFV